jgi:hypothetical protein
MKVTWCKKISPKHGMELMEEGWNMKVEKMGVPWALTGCRQRREEEQDDFPNGRGQEENIHWITRN